MPKTNANGIEIYYETHGTGSPLVLISGLGYPLWQREPGRVPKHGLYRWHIMDPIRFDEDLKVTIQELGWWPNGQFQPLTDDIASVGYWYQAEPHAAFPALLAPSLRWSR